MKRTLYTLITTDQGGFVLTLYRILLFPFYLLYGVVISIRNLCYTSGFIKQKKLPCSVISVGNIVAGGTGKTPTVAAIARLLQKDAYKVGLLLRGYKGKSKNKVTIVSDGEKQLCSREVCGDEADMLARQLPNIPVVVGRQRYLTGKTILERSACDVLILDDGFQHRQLSRDLDILTIDATHPFGTGKMLPIGTLREPKSSIQRADILLLTRTDAVNTNIGKLKIELNRLAPNIPILESIHKPVTLYQLNQQNKDGIMSIDTLSGKRILAVCGIGNPIAFVETLEKYNPATVELLAFPDHHVYSESHLQQIERVLKQSESDVIVITQKDEQKLASLQPDLPIVVLGVELVITDGIEVILQTFQSDSG